MVIRAAGWLVLYVLATHAMALALLSGVWWAFDSGPLASSPELVLAQNEGTAAVRVYGDHEDLDVESAARRTVAALDAAGGFDRSVLMVTIPTGSGWVDPEEVSAIEEWAGDDIATVAMRYSAAPSGAVFALRPELAVDSAYALLREVTQRLRELPEPDRPQLVVHGLSLGAQAGVAALADPVISELVDAALWQGRPGAGADGDGDRDRDRDNQADHCEVSEVNPDDPVAQLSWDLLREPGRAIKVLAALPGSDSAVPGIGHRYLPITPPDGCVTPGA